MTHLVVYKSHLDAGEILIRFRGTYDDCVAYASLHHDSDLVDANTGRRVTWVKKTPVCVICRSNAGRSKVILANGKERSVCSPCQKQLMG